MEANTNTNIVNNNIETKETTMRVEILANKFLAFEKDSARVETSCH